jgi:hypothetical protein
LENLSKILWVPFFLGLWRVLVELGRRYLGRWAGEVTGKIVIVLIG